jgi:hypothetical protein
MVGWPMSDGIIREQPLYALKARPLILGIEIREDVLHETIDKYDKSDLRLYASHN